MRMKIRYFGAAAALLGCTVAGLLFAQNRSRTSSTQLEASGAQAPIQVLDLGVRQDIPDGAGRLSLSLTNLDQRQIEGYVLALSLTAPDGSSAGTLTRSVAAGLLPTRPLIQSGETWEQAFNIPVHESGVLAQYEVTVDHVRFSDSGTWGPNLHGQAAKVEGMVLGSKMVRAHLKRLQNEGKDDEILEIVSRFP